MAINSMENALVGEYMRYYIERVFYFCLKKTSNEHEADDLSQDISLCILSELSRGVVPENFSAWVWRIARNRYARWADKKRRRAEFFDIDDVGEFEIADGDDNALDKMIRSEDMAALRRELAFISSDYRNIVVEYYIKNKSISDIASLLSLPEGTVKSKLFRARKILKEGMNMARQFGKMSYAPENISFINNGIYGKDGEPWKYISRLLCKNILLAAYRTPSTAEELSIEVGVALPYMEEELRELAGATLMKKNGDKYETNFFIVSAEAQEKIYAHLAGIAPELTKAVIAALEYKVKCLNENRPDWHGGYQPWEDMKWTLLMDVTGNVSYRTDKTPEKVEEYKKTHPGVLSDWGNTIRPNGGEWDILGLEACNAHAPAFVGLHGCYLSRDDIKLGDIDFEQYHFKYRGIDKKAPQEVTFAEGKAALDIVTGKGENVNPAIVEKLVEYGYFEKTADGLKPTFLVMNKKEYRDGLTNEQKTEYDALVEKAVAVAKRHSDFCREQILAEIPDALCGDEHQIENACRNIKEFKGAVLEEALRTGYISYDESADNRGLGAYLFI